MKKKILVIGAAGFVGSNLVRYLLYCKNNYTVIGLDRIEDAKAIHNIYSNKAFDFYIADILDKNIVSKILEISRPNIIINLLDKVEETFCLVNIISNCDFLQNVRIIQLSKVDVYKSIENTREYDERGAKDIVEADHICCEDIIINYCQALNISYNIIRTDFIFGPRQHGCFDIINRCYNGAKEGCISLSNKGENKRNITYIEDINNAIIILIEKNEKDQIYNVSSGSDFTDLEIAFIIKEAAKSDAEIGFNFYDDDIYYNINTDKIRKLGWKPKLPLKQRLQQAIDWFEKNPWYLK